MIPRNVPYGSGCWVPETVFPVGLAYQREVSHNNQDHMPAEGYHSTCTSQIEIKNSLSML